MNKEFEFLNIINKVSKSPYLGDDCAYLKEYNLVLSQDSLIEDVHFSLKYMTPYEIAKKALLANISDILASGAKPKYYSVALSGKIDDSFIKEFYKGLYEISKKFDIELIGGDLTKSEKIAISITILGDSKDRNISSRKNARDGYIIATMGTFGSSIQGLYDLEHSINSEFIKIHKEPILFPEISNAIALSAKNPYAMMDSSDGLFDCLYQISQKSNVRIDIDYSKINKKVDNFDYVIYGGEDYCLVVALSEEDFSKIEGLNKIGVVKSGKGVFINDKELEYKSYEHFK